MEAIAGSIKASGRGTIVGGSTGGKETLQTIFPLADGSTLRLTTAMMFLGKTGDPIEGVGLKPDVVVEEVPSKDLSLEYADKILREDEVIILSTRIIPFELAGQVGATISS